MEYKRSGNKARMKTVAVPERRRSEIGITFRPVEYFSPLEGTAFAGANCRGDFSFRHNPVSFLKEMGL